MTDVLYPVANCGEHLVWASDLARDQRRPAGMTCVGCDHPVSLRAGKKLRAHFAHRAHQVCTGPETALHSVAVRVIADALTQAIATRQSYEVQWRCVTCHQMNEGDLAQGQSRSVAVDTALPGSRFRPDVTVFSSGRPRVAIEVVVTHDVEEATAAYFDVAGMAVIRVWPTWETLPALRDGFRLGHGAPRFKVSGAVQCRFPAHEAVVPCRTCLQPADMFRLETVHGRKDCWRCQADVPILEVFRTSDSAAFTASAPEVSGIETITRITGVRLEHKHSKTAGTRYLMHHCAQCAAKIGDVAAYSYEMRGHVQAGESVRFAARCPLGHWTPVVSVSIKQTRSPSRRDREPLAMWGRARAGAKEPAAAADLVDAEQMNVRKTVAQMFRGAFYN